MAILQTFRGVTFDLATPKGMADYKAAIANPNFGQSTTSTRTIPGTPTSSNTQSTPQINSAIEKQYNAEGSTYYKDGDKVYFIRKGDKDIQPLPTNSDQYRLIMSGQLSAINGSPYKTASTPSNAARDLSISLANNTQNTQSTPASSSTQSGSIEDTLYQQLASYLEDLKKRGQVLNPNVQITPEQAAQFTAQAQKEIDPYYATQLKLARESLLRSVGYSQQELDAHEKQLEQKYGTDLRQTGENYAEQGFAQSGLRNRAEGQLATDTQNQIDSGRRALNFGAEGLAQGFAQQYGTRDLPSLSGSSAPTVQAGQSGFTRPQGQSSYYQLSPDVYDGLVGSKQFEQRGAVRSRASELESAFRTGQSLNEQRQLL